MGNAPHDETPKGLAQRDTAVQASSPAANFRPYEPVTNTELSALTRAFELAGNSPLHNLNPRVGCVILDRDGTTLAEGFHRGAGTAHAEAAALASAVQRGIDVHGATAVVSLEPCSHTGRTGPCAQALIDAGIERVVFSVPDPTPLASGGAETLRAAGVDVVGGVRASEGRLVLGHWWNSAVLGRPYVILKTATTLDGRIAAPDGTSQWITGPQARHHAHVQRSLADAVAVGTHTVLVDNPSLTARPDGGLTEHQPLRVVVGDSDIPADAAVRGIGGELVHIRSHNPADVVRQLAERGVHDLIVEGGATLAAAFLSAGLVDEVQDYLAPTLLGAGLPSLEDHTVTTLSEAKQLQISRVVRLGEDLLIVAHPRQQFLSAAEEPDQDHNSVAQQAAQE